MNSKITSYIGFCIKKGSVVFGIDAIEVFRGKIHLILVSVDTGKNTMKSLRKQADKKIAPIYVTVSDKLEDICFRKCKVIGILDKGLATAIINEINKESERDFVDITEVKPI